MHDEIADRDLRDVSHRGGDSPEAHTTERMERGSEREKLVPPNLIDAQCDSITPEMLTLVELDQEQIAYVVGTVRGGARNVQDIYPLSPTQEGMLFHHVLNQGSDTYLLSTLFELQSHSHAMGLTDALQKVVDRHDTLRTAMLWEQLPRPLQVVYRQAKLPVKELILDSDCDPIEQLKQRMVPQPQKLDLSRAPLMRLYTAADPHGTKWYGLLQVHHLICDYQSIRSVIAEAMACLEGRHDQLPAPSAYRNYVAQVLTHSATLDAEAYFHGRFGGVEDPTAPFGLLDVQGDGSQIEEAREAIEPALAQKIRIQAKCMGVSAARLFHAAWGLVVAHTSGQDDVVFGTVLSTSRQSSAKASPIVGMSINTLPLRLELQDVTAKGLVEQTQMELRGLLSHAATPLTVAQRCSGIKSTAPLFTALFNYRRSQPGSQRRESGSFGVREIAYRGAWSNYPVVLQVDDLGEGFMLIAQTDPSIDPRRMMAYMRTAMQSLVEALEQAPSTPALALSIVPVLERHELIQGFNATKTAFPSEKLIQELFQEQVSRTPNAIALSCGDLSLTYAQLNRRANEVAHALQARGVQPDDRVGLYVERSAESVVGFLGILKAGGAYVPLDVNYPVERLQFMLQDSAPTVLLTRERLKQTLSMNGAQVLTFDSDAEEIDRQPDRNPDAQWLGLNSRHMAYVIYTSGSTGVPKGVMIEHRNVINLINWHCSAFNLHEGSRVSSVAAMGFDAAGWEIWPPLCCGATLVLAPSEIANDVETLLAWWVRQTLDVSFLPTPMAEFVVSRNTRNPHLGVLLVGGDRLRHRPPPGLPMLVNNYGPTESTVVATSGRIHDDDPVLHIGRPIANTQIYILNDRGQIAPLGVGGELYIGGAGVARGYLNRPELTAQYFLADPFSNDGQARMYRTGDLGRWRTDGTIEYLGRNDHQVKIRGYRIELGEIEVQLARLPGVKDAVVIAREDTPDRKHLVAYLTQRDQGCSVERLRAGLGSVLPEYMVPNAFVLMERLPLTPNGKIDLRALPAPDTSAYAGREYQAPQTEVECDLAEMWRRLLSVERVGRDDNFFDLGGHSLLVMQAIMRIRSGFSVEMPMRMLFEFPTLRKLAEKLEELRREQFLCELSDFEDGANDLLERVASMSESQVKQLVSELSRKEGL